MLPHEGSWIQPSARIARGTSSDRVAIHLPTGEHLLATDRPRAWWRDRGSAGDQTVVCLDCHELGRKESWLVYAAGTVQQAHLRHQPHINGAELVDHAGESVWHLTAKRAFEHWARSQPHAISAIQEHRVTAAQVNRRADVYIHCDQGSTAVELQFSPLDPLEWQRRQSDYSVAGVNGYWFFDQSVGPSLESGSGRSGLSCFLFDPFERTVVVLMCRAKRPDEWWETDDLVTLVDHPAREGETWDAGLKFGLDQFQLSASGSLIIPAVPALHPDLDAISLERDQARSRANVIRESRAEARRLADERRSRARAVARAESTEVQEPGGGPRIDGITSATGCRTCGQSIDPCLSELGVHFGC